MYFSLKSDKIRALGSDIMRRVVLASESPRRRELMMLSDIPFMTANGHIDETLDVSMGLAKGVEKLACDKALHALQKYPNEMVIGADTVVCLDGEIMGKPKDKEDAFRMLRKLSGKTHEVVTGVAIISESVKEVFNSITSVTFYELSDQQIEEYIKKGEFHDKAGAYGIQGKGALLVKEIQGDYFNVVGLPIAELVRRLSKYIER